LSQAFALEQVNQFFRNVPGWTSTEFPAHQQKREKEKEQRDKVQRNYYGRFGDTPIQLCEEAGY
jgi:hypothetical protein